MEAFARLAEAGFDLVHAFATNADAVARDPRFAALAGGRTLGLLVGNTRALWPRFTAARRDPTLAADPDPLDRYTEHIIDAAFPAARIFYGHRTYGGTYVPLQHLAVATGLGAFAPSQLVIHPIHGPWFALRAVVLVADDGGSRPRPAPIAQPCRCDTRCATALSVALAAPPTAAAGIAVRDGCTLNGSRYSDEQIAFHYARLVPSR
ncbi:MAG: hypothetical protein H0X17_12955 [Deltaproteobacteria bacterium]|nr:hypothetical protein [Deltaproteobacteria bacterium]